MNSLRLALISDLHAFRPEGTQPRPSYFDITAPTSEPSNVAYELIREIERVGAVADYLVCAGDMGDKAEPTATRYCWDRIRDIAHALGGATVVSTAGNHDLDSRFIHNGFDARSVLQDLQDFPTADKNANLMYWSYHFAIIDEPEVRFVLLNTAAYHGYVPSHPAGGPDPLPEYFHGRISMATVTRLIKELDALGPSHRTNLLIAHHHPNNFKLDGKLGEDSSLDGGQALLRRLGEAGHGQWTFIHGHNHAADVYRSAGGARAPWVFSAGSFASLDVWSSKNQFYMLQFDHQMASSLGINVACRFETWNLEVGVRWQKAGSNDNLPGEGGFGKASVESGDVQQVVAAFDTLTSRRRPCTWKELTKEVPWLLYVQPSDLRILARDLEQFDISVDENPDVLYQIRTLDVKA